MKTNLIPAFLLSVLLAGASCRNSDTKETKENFVNQTFRLAEQHTMNMLKVIPDPIGFPRTIDKEGKLVTTPMNDWTEGFFPGSLWYLYEHTKSDYWKTNAVKWTEALEPNKTFTDHHDIGFLMYCSFGNGYRLTGDVRYKEILIESANSLCTRYSDAVGSIQSWNDRFAWNKKDYWNFPVIIDNMMNLELLYFATKVTGDLRYAEIATKHAEKAAAWQIRDDYSHYHVVSYNPRTGDMEFQSTAQGFANNSTWARGQAWAIYGYTMVYRETKDPKFLTIAQRCADFWLNHPNLPEDMVPYWDFNAGQEGYVPDWDYHPERFTEIPRDASAAAITASALFELAKYAPNGNTYYNAAVKTLQSLASPAYMAPVGTNGNFILMHSVGSIPHGVEIDVPLVYADYYFLEALTRYQAS